MLPVGEIKMYNGRTGNRIIRDSVHHYKYFSDSYVIDLCFVNIMSILQTSLRTKFMANLLQLISDLRPH